MHIKTIEKRTIVVILVTLVTFLVSMPSAVWSVNYTMWFENSENPIFAPGKAYYPTVIYDADNFNESGGIYSVTPYYKIWYSKSGGIAFAYSDDGTNWTDYGGVLGLKNGASHAHVIYDARGFGGTSIKYKIWYWDTSLLYTVEAMRYAGSEDGINWTNDQVLTQNSSKPIVTGISPDWNRGTYGPIDVFYNGSASNSGSNPFDYSYAMYYDGTTGGVEQIGLGYSTDGINWTGYGSGPVLPYGGAGEWDSDYTGFGTVIKIDGLWHIWFSGGMNSIDDGMGHATSPDGINWVRDPNNPFMHVTDGVLWRDDRTYTPTIVYNENEFGGHGNRTKLKMWFTGKDLSTGKYRIGYAVLDTTPPTYSNPTPLNNSYTSDSGQDVSIIITDEDSDINAGSLLMTVEGINYDTNSGKLVYDANSGSLTYFAGDGEFVDGQVVDIEVQAKDNVGNLLTVIWGFVVDLVSPDITINSPLNTTYNTTGIAFDITTSEAIDANAGVMVYNDGNAGLLYILLINDTSTHWYNTSVSLPSDGRYNVTFQVADLAGNSNSSTIWFSIDTTPPSTTTTTSTTTTSTTSTTTSTTTTTTILSPGGPGGGGGGGPAPTPTTTTTTTMTSSTTTSTSITKPPISTAPVAIPPSETYPVSPPLAVVPPPTVLPMSEVEPQNPSPPILLLGLLGLMSTTPMALILLRPLVIAPEFCSEIGEKGMRRLISGHRNVLVSSGASNPVVKRLLDMNLINRDAALNKDLANRISADREIKITEAESIIYALEKNAIVYLGTDKAAHVARDMGLEAYSYTEIMRRY